MANSQKTRRSRLRQVSFIFLFATFIVPGAGRCGVNITTQGYDNARTGQNLAETKLNTSNVSPATFGKLFTRAVDDEIYAQPLYVSGVPFPGKGKRNALYVATVNNSVYAFDADDPSDPAPRWHVNLTGKERGERPVQVSDVGQNCPSYHDFTKNIGIVGTPVVDLPRQTLFVVTRTRRYASTRDLVASRIDRLVAYMQSLALNMERSDFAERLSGFVGSAQQPIIYAATGTLWRLSRNLDGLARGVETGEFLQRLHALDITTGAERPNSPVLIEATVRGTGSGSWNGKLNFRAGPQNQRGALLLANNTVYITWAAHCDTGPYHGWILGYDASTLNRVMATVVTPDGRGGGIWQSNSGPSADASGDVYLTVGNGTVTAPEGGNDYGNAFLKLNRRGKILDWFIPFNFEYLNSVDGDVGASGVLLIPGTNLLTSGGKEGKLYVLDRNKFGNLQPESDDQIEQIIHLNGPIRATPSYWAGPGGPYVYTWCYSCRGQAFRVEHGRLSAAAISETSMTSGRGGIFSISASGTTAGTGILWVNSGTLRAFDAADLSRELWNSEQDAARDDFGAFAKFNTPVVANGKVYLATFSNQVAIFGLKPQANAPPDVNAGLDQTIALSEGVKLSGTVHDDSFLTPGGLRHSPEMSAGPDQTVAVSEHVAVKGTVDNRLPTPAGLQTTWLKVSGPGQVIFRRPQDLSTEASFTAAGEYVLRLSASDGELATEDNITVRVTSADADHSTVAHR